MGYLAYDCYQLGTIIEFLRKIFLTGNGEAISTLLNLSISFDSMISLKYFNDCVLFDFCNEDQIKVLEPEFYQMKEEQNSMISISKINVFQDSLESYIGFQFKKLPLLLEPYFSYIHLSKYMQILTFIVRIRHANDLVARCWKLLN